MATRRQRWSPDTCGCVIEYDIDTVTGATTPVQTERTCVAHAALSVADRHTTLYEENPRKNLLLKRLMELWPAIFGEQQADGSITWKQNVILLTWSGTGTSRLLTVDTQGALTSPQRTTAQAWCDANLGAGRVLIV